MSDEQDRNRTGRATKLFKIWIALISILVLNMIGAWLFFSPFIAVSSILVSITQFLVMIVLQFLQPSRAQQLITILLAPLFGAVAFVNYFMLGIAALSM